MYWCLHLYIIILSFSTVIIRIRPRYFLDSNHSKPSERVYICILHYYQHHYFFIYNFAFICIHYMRTCEFDFLYFLIRSIATLTCPLKKIYKFIFKKSQIKTSKIYPVNLCKEKIYIQRKENKKYIFINMKYTFLWI